jgi:glycosyltransferase involved in cell wall biosynthesis
MERSLVRSSASFVSTYSDTPAPLLVCFSHLRWDFVWQRPQHLLSRAARHYRVLQIEEPLFEDGAKPRIDVSKRAGGITIAVPILPKGLSPHDVTAAQRTLVTRLLAAHPESARIFWYYTPMAMAFTSHLDCDLCVYDNMDELSLFRGASQEMIDLESELFRRADVVFTGGMSLYEAKRNRHRNVHGFPSSIDFEHFAKARRAGDPEPADQVAIPRPRLGFFGVIDERMDIDLVGSAAELRPDWHFVMIGPVVKIDPAGLPKRDNIHWLGGKSYADLPRYLSGWDVGVMPFALNESTRFISPTKTPEYLAAGKPVVSTPITDVVRTYGGDIDLARIARTVPEFVAAIEAALHDQESRTDWLRRTDRLLGEMSWDRTWSQMRDILK